MVIKLKILFKNTTQYNKSIYEKYVEFHNKKYSFSYRCYTLFVVAIILFCLISQVQYDNFSVAFLFCCILTAFVLWRVLHPASVISKELKSDNIQNEKIFTFKFYDKFFTVEDNKQYSKLKYYKLYKVFEVDDFFYLYIDKTHAFLLDKSKFKNDASPEFSKFIKKKCWWCFKNSTK